MAPRKFRASEKQYHAPDKNSSTGKIKIRKKTAAPRLTEVRPHRRQSAGAAVLPSFSHLSRIFPKNRKKKQKNVKFFTLFLFFRLFLFDKHPFRAMFSIRFYDFEESFMTDRTHNFTRRKPVPEYSGSSVAAKLCEKNILTPVSATSLPAKSAAAVSAPGIQRFFFYAHLCSTGHPITNFPQSKQVKA